MTTFQNTFKTFEEFSFRILNVCFKYIGRYWAYRVTQVTDSQTLIKMSSHDHSQFPWSNILVPICVILSDLNIPSCFSQLNFFSFPTRA